MMDQAEKLRSMVNKFDIKKDDNIQPKIITITSGKGGVGKSNFVVNLGIYMQSQGKKVIIFDADIGMANDDILMGVNSSGNIFDVISGRKDISEVVLEGPYGVKLIPGGSALNRIEELTENEKEVFLEKISNLINFDYILMDTGAGISKNVLGFIGCSDEVVFLTTPEPTALTDCYGLIKATKHYDLKQTGYVVVNRAFDKREALNIFVKLNSVANKFLNMDLGYLGYIYDDRKVLSSVRNQRPFIIEFPDSDASISISKIGDKIMGERTHKNSNGIKGLFKKIFDIFS